MYFQRFFRKPSRRTTVPAKAQSPVAASSRPSIEGLEDRRLLSASHLLGAASVLHAANSSSHSAWQQTTTTFGAAPAAVQSGLQAIAPAGTTIAGTQTVYVRTLSSTTSLYSVKLTATSGPGTRLTVDQDGLPAGNEKITLGQLQAGPANDKAIATGLQNLAPTGVTLAGSQAVLVRTGRDGTTTFTVGVQNANGTVTKITVDSTGAVVTNANGRTPAGANTILFSAATTAVKNGLQALAPTGTTIDASETLYVQKLNATTTLYSVKLADSTTGHDVRITVNQTGLPAGDESVRFSQLQNGPSNDQAIASAFQNLAPSGVTIDGTQTVFVRTFNGTSTYSVTVDNSGTSTKVTVDGSGASVTPATPSATTTTFGAAPAAVQAGLQAIAPSGTTIASDQTVYVLTLGNASYYSLNLNTETSSWGFGRGWGQRITVDASGLPSGNQQITFGQLQNGPTNDKAIATALQGLAPGGVTIAAATAVRVATVEGTTTYTVDVSNSNGTTSEITVDTAGTAVSPPAGGGGGFGGGGPHGGGFEGGGGFGHRGFGGGFGRGGFH